MFLEKYMLPCFFKEYTGIPCPGCGGQRSLAFILHGNFKEAFFMYPAIYPLLVFGGLIIFNFLHPFKAYHRYVTYFSIIAVITILVNYYIELNQIFNFFK